MSKLYVYLLILISRCKKSLWMIVRNVFKYNNMEYSG